MSLQYPIKSFDTIRPCLRAAVAGILRTTDAETLGITSAQFRDAKTRLRHFLPESRQIRTGAASSVRTDRYANGSTNALAALYRSKLFTPEEMAMLLLLLQTAGNAKAPLTLEAFIESLPPEKQGTVSKKMLRRLCRRLRSLGVLSEKKQKNAFAYRLVDDKLAALDDNECQILLSAIGFYKNVSPLGLYGSFLEDLLCHRLGRMMPQGVPAQFLHANGLRLIDEEIVVRIRDARTAGRLLHITYRKKTYDVWPLAITEDAQAGGRQALAGLIYRDGSWPYGRRRSLFPFDRLTDAVLGDGPASPPPEALPLPTVRIQLRIYASNRRSLHTLRQEIAVRYRICTERATSSDPAPDSDAFVRDMIVETEAPFSLIPFVQERCPAIVVMDGPKTLLTRLAQNLKEVLALYGQT